jgi:cytochrome c peroxidase
MRAILILGILCGSCFLLTALMRPAPHSGIPSTKGIDSTLSYFKKEAPQFAASCQSLLSAIRSINTKDPHSTVLARQKLRDCRLHYKRIESFMEYFFRSPARIYNSPPKYEPEEPDMEYQSPIGLQVIESLLYDNDDNSNKNYEVTARQKNELLQQTVAVASSAADLPSLLYDFQADDRQLLESLRIELIRIISLGITGYDAPSLKSGLSESREALQSMRVQLQPYLNPGEPGSDSLLYFLDRSITLLLNNPGFDAFDRLAFLTTSALPLQHQLNVLIRERQLELNTNGVLNYKADNLFSPDALIMDSFPASPPTLIEAGRQLFSEKSLSGNGQRSCATCHSPEKMFTDQLPANSTFDGHGSLKRNTPTLLYSGFQYRQFWDGRANTLEEQIRTVLQDSLEMNGKRDPSPHTVSALAAYIRSLHPMNSPFDRYMRGDTRALNAREIKGANLFMGKAQCATCHFIPLFNGLIPPDYKLTEFEILGTTRTDQFDQPRLSTDQGRYALFPFDFLKGAFKTPTVRNVANTYPYMHNGAFHSLEKVMEFYNKGGGAGLGLKVPEQTLPASPLHLSDREMQDIILFLHSLTDDLHSPNEITKATAHK